MFSLNSNVTGRLTAVSILHDMSLTIKQTTTSWTLDNIYQLAKVKFASQNHNDIIKTYPSKDMNWKLLEQNMTPCFESDYWGFSWGREDWEIMLY